MKKCTRIFAGGLLLVTMLSSVACGGDNLPDNVVADKYKISIACQTEMGEEEVLRKLKEEYEKKNSKVEIEIHTFSGEGFEQYMGKIAADQSMSPNIIWTADAYHSYWDEYFVDLRPYYESSAETDYSLYYETMLDTASTNGQFKPTKNYTNPLGGFNREKDENSDGKEHYSEHSEYGLFYAPRDYNKPAILCNTNLFAKLDGIYETVYKRHENVTEMPEGYQSTTERLNQIVIGEDWDTFYDLSDFVRGVAEKMMYVMNNGSKQESREWTQRAVFELYLQWEPTYTTVMNALNIDLIGDGGSLNLAANREQLQALHNAFTPSEDAELAAIMNAGDITFASGNLFMTVCSRPVVAGYNNTFKSQGLENCLEAIPFPVANIAAGNSGYAISSIWEGKGMTVDGEYRSYTDLSWDFIKFIITQEGQEIAGATGLNIPVLKELRDLDTAAWRNVSALGNMDHNAWVAGGELKQDTYNIFNADKRNAFRNIVNTFFSNLLKTNYNEGSLESLINVTTNQYNLNGPANQLRR